MTGLSEKNVIALEKAGYEVVEHHMTDGIGHIVVSDPVQCSSGSKCWREYRHVTLRNAASVRSFIDERN